MEEPQQDVPVSSADRRTWLAKLDIQGRIKSPLLDALYRGDQQAALQVLNAGNVDTKTLRTRARGNLPTGLTALHLACLFGDEAVVARLLKMNADPRVTCYSQITSHSVSTKFWMDARPLLFAVGAKNKGIVERLVQHGTPITMDDAWPLFSSEWWRLTGRFDWTQALEILRLLVQNRLDVNQCAAKIRWTLLHYCIVMEPRSVTGAEGFVRGRYETVSYLLSNGADALLKDSFGRTPYALLEDRSSEYRDTPSEHNSIKEDADGELMELLKETMLKRLNDIKQSHGLKGSFQRLAVHGQSLERLPLLLRNGASSLRRFSLSSDTNASHMSDIASQA